MRRPLAKRNAAKSSLGQFEQAKSDAQQAMRLSPRDPYIGLWHVFLGSAELGLGHFDAALNEYRNATDSGFRTFYAYADLAAAYAREGKMDEARTALAETRRLSPEHTVKWLQTHSSSTPPLLEGLRKALVHNLRSGGSGGAPGGFRRAFERRACRERSCGWAPCSRPWPRPFVRAESG